MFQVDSNHVIKIYFRKYEKFRSRHNWSLLQNVRAKDPTETYFVVDQWRRHLTVPMIQEMFGSELVDSFSKCPELEKFLRSESIVEVSYQTRVDRPKWPLSLPQYLHLEKGLAKLHTEIGATHGDIQRANIGMLRGNPVLIDWDLADYIPSLDEYMNDLGAFRYMMEDTEFED